MENGDSLNSNRVIASLAGTGVLGVIAAGMLAVANDARIAINVAEQHGQELLMIRGELASVRTEMMQRTEDRYTSRDADQHEKYMERRLNEIEKKLNEIR
jgi:hypothetical protein